MDGWAARIFAVFSVLCSMGLGRSRDSRADCSCGQLHVLTGGDGLGDVSDVRPVDRFWLGGLVCSISTAALV